MLLIGLTMLAATDLAVAQDYYGGEYESTPYDPGTSIDPYDSGSSDYYYDESGSGLPDWAAPGGDYSEGYDGSITGYDDYYDSPFSDPAPEAVPGDVTPPPPSRVPVDGGLMLLAAAGAGYAVRKLRNQVPDSPADA